MFTLSKPEDSLTKKEIVTVPAPELLADLYELGQAWGFQQCLAHNFFFLIDIILGRKFKFQTLFPNRIMFKVELLSPRQN